MTFRATPKGSLGRFATDTWLNQFYPAEVIESVTGTKIEAANFPYANLIAGLLNDPEKGRPPEPATSCAPLPRYLTCADPRGRGWRVVARFSGDLEGYIARTDDESLAGWIALVLNRVDPGVMLVPPRRRRSDLL